MSETKPFPVPCDDCGAQVGQPCKNGCPMQDGFCDENDETNFEGTGMSEREIRDMTIDEMEKLGIFDGNDDIE